eukprot:CAMPEP_0113940442 /NCGR_PEP_ID=MMETSP1339-20121228/6567_1 /TAXON_ID=94617 /ORGANISM="Fibrocapsa japonica" /LENGTH=342 /DNA_ID=CAMNT_0000944273 /DNA_START=45 /DNA_END=1073 /DNA_ORIENTATION=+ /assembly_acc=CAM_ASM_000762
MESQTESLGPIASVAEVIVSLDDQNSASAEGRGTPACRTGEDSRGQLKQELSSRQIPISILECGVCLSLLCEPISLSCGHSFCRHCLVRTLKKSRKKCPSCRAVCHTSPEDQAENVVVTSVAQHLFPEIYAQRLAEAKAERQSWNLTMPIFYYNLPMFPGNLLSLHLFEPRYKLMMKRIVNSNRKFAYVPNYTSYTAKAGDIALIAELQEVEFLSDGRVLLEAKLVGRHRVVEHFVEDGTQNLHYCALEEFGDDPVSSEDEAKLSALTARASEIVTSVFMQAEAKAHIVSHYGEMPSDPENLSLWIVSVLPMPVTEKHAMLESANTLHRMEQCVAGLSALEK